MNKFNILEHTSNIRASWLKSFKIYGIFSFVYFNVHYITAFYADVINNNSNISLESAIGITLFMLAMISSMLALHYYFGYKKQGTYLLAWVSIFGGLKLLSNILTMLKEMPISFNEFGVFNPIINFYYILEIGAICIAGYYLNNCWKLYSLNAELKKQSNLK